MREYLTDKVSLIRKNGDRVEDIPALVQGNKIMIDDIDLKMEEGDKLTRMLPNGIEEAFLILNLKYYLASMKFVEIDVRKETQIDARKPSSQEFHLHGNNSQMNINSPNSNLNSIIITQDKLFETLRSIVNEQITDINAKSELFNQVEKLEKAEDKKSFSERYNEFIASAANHANLWVALSPLIPTFMDLMNRFK